MMPRVQGSAMKSRTQECTCDEDGDAIEVVVGEDVDAEDDLDKVVVDEASHRVCQVRGHDDSTLRCCQH
jgi:hypothetical protein